MATNEKQEEQSLVAFQMPNKQIESIDKAGQAKSRNRSAQIRAMLAWVLNHKRVLNSI